LIVTTNVSETWYATHFALFQVISDDTQSLCVFENHPAGTLQGEAGSFAHHVFRSVIGLFPGEFNEIGGDITRVTTGTGTLATRRDGFAVTHSGSIRVLTQSAAPAWTGREGEIVPVSDGSPRLYVFIGGSWKSTHLS
jgi:hypothetical protein